MNKPENVARDSCASLDVIDLSRLAVAQKASLKASEQLRIAIERDLEPLLRECKTQEDVLAVKFAVRKKIGCSLDGLMEVHFAIAYVGRE